jgi:Putative prokaryotic signal transducing protein
VPTEADDVVTLTRLNNLTAAQLLCGRLDAEGIEARIPDEVMAAQTWHLNCAIGGIRVQVHQRDLERAKEILADPALAENLQDESAQGSAAAGTTDGDDGTISPGDRAAYRSLRVALVSLWLMGLVHPYSLYLAVRALGQKDLTTWGRWRAWVALGVSLLGCGWMAFLVLRFVQMGR